MTHTSFINLTTDHLSLPSFPTRRSSDLQPSNRPTPQPPESPRWVLHWFLCSLPTAAGSKRTSLPKRSSSRSATCRERSEEHTSELQSHSDLVCRLLLEKKKSNMKYTCHI